MDMALPESKSSRKQKLNDLFENLLTELLVYDVQTTAFQTLLHVLPENSFNENTNETLAILDLENNVKQLEFEVSDVLLKKSELSRKATGKIENLEKLSADIQKLKEESSETKNNYETIRSQLNSLNLEEEKRTSKKIKASKKTKRLGDLLMKISGLTLDHTTEPNNVRGFIHNETSQSVKGFSYNLTQLPEFDVCNKIWDLIENYAEDNK